MTNLKASEDTEEAGAWMQVKATETQNQAGSSKGRCQYLRAYLREYLSIFVNKLQSDCIKIHLQYFGVFQDNLHS